MEQKQKVSDVFFRAKDKVLLVQKKVFLLKINLDELKRFFQKHKILFTYTASFLLVIFIIIFSLSSKADVASFYPTNCLGSWENPKNAEGVPNVKNNKDINDFSANNSAILNNTNGDLFCGDFRGEIPKDIEPKKFILKFSILATDKLLEDQEPVPTLDEIKIPDLKENTPPATDSTTSNTTSFLNKILPNVYAQEVLPPPDASAIDGNPSSDSLSTTPENNSPDNKKDIIKDNPPDSSSVDQNQNNLIPSDDNNIAVPPSNNSAVEPTSVDTLPSDIKVANDYLKVSYSTDGTDWKLLGTINEDNISDPNFEIPIENMKWEDVSKIQISISPVISIDKNKIFYLDGMWIESEYDKILNTKALPKISLDDSSLNIISGNADFSNNEDIVFNVNDPTLSKYEIAQLVTKDKAKILEDKDKVLETYLGTENISGETPAKEETPSIELPPVPMDGNLLKNTKNAIENIISPKHTPLPSRPSIEDIKKKENNNITSFLFGNKALADTTSHITEAKVLDARGNNTKIETSIGTVTVDGKEIEQVHVTKPAHEFKPGKYSLHITLETDTAIIETEQDFTWGVLVVNTNKSIYNEGDNVYLQMGVLNDGGHTLCNADLDMDITTPSGTLNHFSTSDKSISKSKKCGPDNITNTPDYSAHFLNTEETGIYKIKLTATTSNGSKTINDGFQVDPNAIFNIERITASRIQPSANYPVTLDITANEDFSGTVIEHVPASFTISPAKKSISYDTVNETDTEKIISWNLDFKKGETKTIGYYYNAPNISPEIFLLGPLELFSGKEIGDPTGKLPDFKEARKWQIASDSATFTDIHDFENGTGIYPFGSLVRASDGKFYGMTNGGGGGGYGTIFSIDPNDGNSYTDILDFDGGYGAFPYGDLLEFDGDLYGMASGGGDYGNGVIFRLTKGFKRYEILYSFDRSRGGIPYGSLIVADNILYGMTSEGGTNGFGVIFRFDPLTNDYLDIYDFDGNSGASPYGNLTLVGDFLYGMTYSGGNANCGVIFKFSIKEGKYTDLYEFTVESSEGFNPSGSFLLSGDYLYGLTGQGGNNMGGTLFEWNIHDDAFTKLYDMDSNDFPQGSLIENNGYLYGMTSGGGINFQGSVFKWDIANSAYTPIYDFNGLEAAYPIYGSLLFDSGYLYGLTLQGGSLDSLGVAFKLQEETAPSCEAITTGNWSDGVNWTGCTGAGGKPGTGDNVVIDAGVTISMDEASASLGTITIASTGELDAINDLTGTTIDVEGVLNTSTSTITLDGTSGTLFTLGATAVFHYDSSTVIMNPDANVTLTSGNPSFYNLSLTPTISANRTYTFGSGNFSILGDFTINSNAPPHAGMFLSVNMGGDITVASTKTTIITDYSGLITHPVSTDYNLTTGYLNIADSGTLDCTSSSSTITLTGTSGTLFTLGVAFGLHFAGNFIAGSSTVVMNPDADVTLTSGVITFYNLTLAPTITVDGRIYSFGSGALTINGDLTINPNAFSTQKVLIVNMGANIVVSGTTYMTGTNQGRTKFYTQPASIVYNLSTGLLNITSFGQILCSSSIITLTGTSGTLFTSNGIFNAATSTVIMNPNANVTLTSGNISFYNLTLSPTITAARTYTFGGGTIAVNRDFTINPSASSSYLLTVNLGNNATVVYKTTITKTSSATSKLVTRPVFTDYNLTTGYLDIETGGTLDCTSSFSTITLTGTSGLSTLFTLLGTFTYGTSTVVMNPDAAVTLTSGTITFYNLSLTPTITNHRIYNFGSGDLIINGDFNVIPTSSSPYKLIINMGANIKTIGTTTLSKTSSATSKLVTRPVFTDYNLTTGYLDIETGGTLDCTSSSSTITLTGTSGTLFTKNASGIFTQGSSSVIFNPDAAVTLTSGTIAFYNLTLSPIITATRTYTFGSGIISVLGSFNITSSALSPYLLTVNMGANITVTGVTEINRGGLNSSQLVTHPVSTDYNLTTGILIIDNGGTLNCANSSSIITLSSSGNVFDNTAGTFTPGSSIIRLTDTSSSSKNFLGGSKTYYNFWITGAGTGNYTISGSNTFNDFKVDIPPHTVMFTNGTTTTVTTFTVSGTSGNLITLKSDSNGNYWNLSKSSGIISSNYLSLQDSHAIGGATFYAGANSTNVSGNSGWIFTAPVCNAVATGNWSDGTKWSGCTGATGKPGAGDAVTINAGVRMTMNENSATLDSITVANTATLDASTYTLTGTTINIIGTFTQGSGGSLILNGTSGTLFTRTGTFNSGTSTVFMESNTDVTLTSGTITFYNLTLDPSITANHIYTFGSGALTVSNTFQIDPTAGSAYSLTVNMGADITVASSGTVSIFKVSSATSRLVTRPSSTDFNISTGMMNIGAGGTLDCTSSSSVITLTGTGVNILFTKNASGIFTAGNSNVLVTSASGSPSLLSSSGNTSFYDLTINTQGAAVVNATAIITVSHNLYVQSGVLNDSGKTIIGNSSGTLQVDASAALCISGTVAATNATCDSGTTPSTASTFPTLFTTGNITLSANSSVYYLANGPMTVSAIPSYGNLYFTPKMTFDRTFTLGGALSIKGNFTINPSASSLYKLTVNMGGDITVISTRNTTITSTSSATSSLVTRVAGTDYNLSTGTIIVTTGGTLDCTSSASNITLTKTSGTLFTLGGSFAIDGGTPTVILSGNGDAIINANPITFYNLTETGGGVKSAGAAIGINNNLTVSAGTFDPTTSYVITGNGTNTLTVNNGGTIRVEHATFAGDYASFETVTLNSVSTVDYYLNGDQTVSSTISPYSNLTTSNGGTKTPGGDLTIGNVMTIGTGTTLVNDGNYNLTLSGTTGTPIVTNGIFKVGNGIISYTGNNPSGNTTIESSVPYTNLTINNASETYVLNGTTNLQGNLTITNGTLDTVSGQNYALNVGGNWTNSGTFTARNGTVTLNSNTQASVGGGPTTFYNLTITNSNAKEVDFSNTAQNIIHVTNTFTVTGHSGKLIKLYSDSTPNKWHFHPTGTAVVDYADVKDGGCEAGAITITPTHSTNGGNNDACWNFYTPTITFSMTGNNADFGTLNTTQSHYATSGSGSGGSTSQVEAHNFTVTDNSPSGYSVSVIGSSLTDAISGHVINPIGGTPAVPNPNTEQFGLRIVATGTGVVSAPYDGTGFAYAADSSTASQVCSAPSGDGTPTVYSVRYLSNISPTTTAGTYHTTLKYLVTGNF